MSKCARADVIVVSTNLQAEYRCARCDLNYPTKSLLIWHIRLLHQKGKLKIDYQPCGAELSTVDILNKPELVQPKCKFHCPKCSKIFHSRQGLRKHSLKFHGLKGILIYDPKNHKCDECGKTFTQLHSFTLHRVSHNPPQFSCNECGRKFFSKTGVLLHTKSAHLGCVLCQQCPMKFTSTEALTGHTKRIHQPQEHKCPNCYKEFETEGRLNSHLLNAHPLYENPDFECKICHKAIKDSRSMANHLRFHGSPTLSCSQCSFKFYAPSHLSMHIKRAHTNLIRYAMPPISNSKAQLNSFCAVCCKSFDSKKDLRRHLTIHYPKSQVCPVCQQTFNGEITFEAHIRLKHKKSRETFNCGMCNKLFFKRETYLKHKRYHDKLTQLATSKASLLGSNSKYSTKSNEKLWLSTRKFGCAICSRRFIVRFSLRKHLSTHKFTTFSCSRCDFQCTTKPTISRHLRNCCMVNSD